MLDKQLKLADRSPQDVAQPQASPQQAKESTELSEQQETQRQRVDGEDETPQGKKTEKDSKCGSSSADGQENGIAGILEGIGLLGLTDQQESHAGDMEVLVKDGEGHAPQDGEIWNISARMPEKDMARIFSANLNAQAVQIKQTVSIGQIEQPGKTEQSIKIEQSVKTEQTACSLENISKPAQVAQNQGKAVDKLSAVFEKIMSRAADDQQNMQSDSSAKPAAPFIRGTETVVPPTGKGQNETEPDTDTQLNGQQEKPDAPSPLKGIAPHVTTLDGTIHFVAKEVPVALQVGERAIPDVQQVQENLTDIVESIRINSGSDVQEFEITLRPEYLGKIQISLIRDETGISAAFKASDRAVRQLLQPQMEGLQQLLKDKGVPITRLEVVNEQSAAANNFSGRQNMGWQQSAYANTNGQRRNNAGHSVQSNAAAIGLYSPAQGAAIAARRLYSSVEFQA